MARSRQHPRLRVYQNNRFVGWFIKQPSGAIQFQYDEEWLGQDNAYPVSLSLPLREDAFRGEPVAAVFENLLPDSDTLRRRVAEKVGADGVDAYSLLSRIGRDCVGAFQFIPEDEEFSGDSARIKGEAVSDKDIEKLLNNLERAPLGLDKDQDFRISIAGAQEKTALLWHKEKWLRPSGTTPTTHILKTQIGTLPNGIDLSDSIENEFYCLHLMRLFGLTVNKAEIKTFGKTKALVIERFDRHWVNDKQLIRIPQEDCCQALSVPPTRKYQSDGGPGMVDILNFLKSSDNPAEDQKIFLKAQILFWLMGATDGHAKNFSIHIGPGGRFRLTPLYDVLTAQPSLDLRQIERKQMKMAMSVGDNGHYKIEEIQGRHFVQTAERAGLPGQLAKDTLEDVAANAEKAMQGVEKLLPKGFPEGIHAAVQKGLKSRLRSI